MFCEDNNHCKECTCFWCELRATDGCLNDRDSCDKCDNTQHIGWCPWNDREE